MTNLEGQTFAGYEILAKLGQGGMGTVYKARQPLLSRIVALKVMAEQIGTDPEFVARFIREAASAASLRHPNLVEVFTAGENNGVYFMAMEFVEGESLRKRLDRLGRIPPQEAVAVTIYIAQALQHAWNKTRLIHRDIKPDNVFLSSAGEVKVGDLGLAKNVGGDTTDLTQSGVMMGSPHYISPEQAQGAKDVDFRADIYSLGCTLYHMLTGQTPYTGDSSVAIIMKHVHDPTPAIFKTWPTCPMPLGMLVGKMLAKDRAARPQSYEQLLAELFAVSEKLQQSAAPAKPAPVEKTTAFTQSLAPSSTANPPAKRKTLTTTYVVAGTAAAVALAGLLLWSPWRTQEEARDRKQTEPSPVQSAASEVAGAQAETPNAVSSNTALRLLGNVYTNAVGAEMVYIPPGEFMMGSTKEEREWAVQPGNMGVRGSALRRLALEGDQEPRSAIIRSGFWVGRTKVTVGQWRQFANATGYRTTAEIKGVAWTHNRADQSWKPVQGASWRNWGFSTPAQDNHPAACISWDDATAFCKWLTDRERAAGRLPTGCVMRLPTEVEWEYACRGGKQGARFWWGNSKEDGVGRVNWSKPLNTDDALITVDQFGERGRNGFGLADMAGNAFDWCLDNLDPKGPHTTFYTDNSSTRVIKGGDFGCMPLATRCAARDGCPADTSEVRYSFRLCLGPDVRGSSD